MTLSTSHLTHFHVFEGRHQFRGSFAGRHPESQATLLAPPEGQKTPVSGNDRGVTVTDGHELDRGHRLVGRGGRTGVGGPIRRLGLSERLNGPRAAGAVR